MEAEIASFLGKYTPELRRTFAAARVKMRVLFPRGFELVYDNYNALVFGYSATERASAALVSIAGYPKWVTLFFLKGSVLADPTRRLEGSGKTVRGIRLASPETLDEPDVKALLVDAMRSQTSAFAQAPALRTVVKSVSGKQRPRRPAKPSATKAGRV